MFLNHLEQCLVHDKKLSYRSSLLSETLRDRCVGIHNFADFRKVIGKNFLPNI